MQRRRVACLAALGASLLMPVSAQSPSTVTLAQLRDRTRPLLIFTGANDPRAEQQLAALSPHAAELRDRDMRVIVVSTAPLPMASQDRNDAALPMATFSPDEAVHARRQFHVAENEFAVVLVGKDGGEKLRSRSSIPWAKLASTVDGMPMRKQEMKRQ